MNRARAQEILAGYRPNRDIATEPEIAAALALLEQDAELARWFENEQALDAALQRKLREIPIPGDLQERILANRPKRLTRPNWWSDPRHLAAAAAVLVIASASALWLAPREPSTWPDYQAQAVEKVTESYDLNIKSRNHDEVRQGMAAAGFPSDYLEPPGLLKYPLKGGFRFRWRGHKVSVICYGASLERKPGVWLIVLNRTPLPGAPTRATPEFGLMGEFRVARWADGLHYYIVATRDGPDLGEMF
jgi:hypothetical protein